MATKTTYEVQSQREGKWVIDSVHDDKALALDTARDLLESPRHKAVQVIEETYDEQNGEVAARLIFNKKRGQEKPEPTKAAPKQVERLPVNRPSAPAAKQGGFVRYLVLLSLALGGIGLALIVALMFLKNAGF